MGIEADFGGVFWRCLVDWSVDVKVSDARSGNSRLFFFARRLERGGERELDLSDEIRCDVEELEFPIEEFKMSKNLIFSFSTLFPSLHFVVLCLVTSVSSLHPTHPN